MRSPDRRTRRAFTIAELIGVMVIVAALSLTAAPALSWMARSRQGALESEIQRLLREARAVAIASGRPAGIHFDFVANTAAPLWIQSDGAPPEPAPGPTGQPTSALAISSAFPSAAALSLTIDGSPASAVWFGYAGAPQVRAADGSLVGAFTGDAVVTLSNERTITVRRITGLVE